MAPKKTLKQTIESNPTALGDPVSLKAEKSDTQPTSKDKPNEQRSSGKKSLKELAKENPTQLGDPVSLKAETADSEPTPNDRGAAASRRRSKL